MKRALVAVGVLVLLFVVYVLVSGVIATDATDPSRIPAETYEFTMEDGGTFTIEYLDEYETAMLEFGGDTYELSRAVSASGARYESAAGDVVFWEKGGEAMIEIDGEMVVTGALPVEDDAANEAAGETGIQTFTVAAERQACTGVAPRECLVVNGELFYDRIAGFNFEPGYTYQLLVNKTRREDAPADASEFEYTLIEEVRKTAVAPASEPSLTNGRWQWVETNYADGDSVVPAEPSAFTLTFDEAGRVAVRTDCNSGSASIVSPDETFSFSPIAMTKRACMGETQEQIFLDMLGAAMGYTFDASSRLELMLDDAPGGASPTANPAGIMVFRQVGA